MKRIKLTAFAFASAFFFFCVPWQKISAYPSQQQSQRPVEIVASGVPLSERIGEDDGALFAVHFIGDTRGRLGPCG